MIAPEVDVRASTSSPSLFTAGLLTVGLLTVGLLSLGLLGCGDEPAGPDAAIALDAIALDASRDDASPGEDAPDAPPAPDASAPTDAGATRCLGGVDHVEGSDALDDPRGRASVTFEGDRDACRRTYVLATTAPRRDELPATPRRVAEAEEGSALRTGHDLFDALFALALDEAREDSVASIEDWGFDEGRPMTCPSGGCFETGRLWRYVWTRDTSYAVDLGLGALDPQRALNSMLFKLSERRGGGGEELVQDTGTGGSYPVSTDRVVWALGASALLPSLEGEARASFADRAYGALLRTTRRDRDVAFDEARGLYRGETSFLDWREQSYPASTADDTAAIAESEALSTNVLHLHALRLTARLARARGEAAQASAVEAEADALVARIREVFWDDARGELRAFTPGELDRAAVTRVDLLGTSLAILEGVVTPEEGRRALSRYPHFERGAPVFAPEQQYTAIYHNRAEWPFVTAYELLAAREARAYEVMTHAARTLVRSAALSLSNLENFEVPSGLPYVEDGAYSGPVVNSQRQLWSVAGYLAFVTRGLFGVRPTDEGLELDPRVPVALYREHLDGASRLTLEAWPVRGTGGERRAVSVILEVPELAGATSGALVPSEVRVDGARVEGPIPWASLGAESRIEVTLRVSASEAGTMNVVDPSDWRAVYGPRTPAITALSVEGGHLRVGFDLGGESADDVRVSVYRDGARIASDLDGTSYLDASWDAGSARTPCYAIETCFVASGTCSQHSAPACFWGASLERATSYYPASFALAGGVLASDHGRPHVGSWGDPGHLLSITHTAAQSGEHLIQLVYGNGAGPVSTGITAVTKRVLVEDLGTGDVVASGVVVMPQLGDWDRWARSTFARATLEAGHSYRVTITSDDATVNMSSFEHFARYTAGTGGDAPFARVNVSELVVLAR